MKDGNVYGIPVDMYGNTFAYSADAWSELGLTEADLPTSILGLMDFIDNWQADYADDYPNLRVIDGDPVKDSLLYNIMIGAPVRIRHWLPSPQPAKRYRRTTVLCHVGSTGRSPSPVLPT